MEAQFTSWYDQTFKASDFASFQKYHSHRSQMFLAWFNGYSAGKQFITDSLPDVKNVGLLLPEIDG